MLDAFIIEEIKRREREQSRDDRPVVELPVPQPAPAAPGRERRNDDDDDDGNRGVVIIDYAAG